MADPRNSPAVPKESQTASPQNATAIPKPVPPPPSGKPVPPPPSGKPAPPPGTYIIKIPRDQVFRVPPPENARRYDEYIRRQNRRSGGCCCFCWIIKFIFILAVLLGIAAVTLFFVFRPEKPKYSINSITIRGINITSPSSTTVISPEFNITVRADNPNDKIGIRYMTDSSAEIFYNDVKLCNGALPAFYQPSNNVTVFKSMLKGNEILLRSKDRRELLKAETKRKVPLTVMLEAPVKIKVGSVMTWKITVKVDCDVTVDKLTAQAKIVSRKCNHRVELW